MRRGYFEIGIIDGRCKENMGTLWRSAVQLGASGIFTIGARYGGQRSDTCASTKRIPYRAWPDWEAFQGVLPVLARANRLRHVEIVAIERWGQPLGKFIHPTQAIYLLGGEDCGIPRDVLQKCNHKVSIESVRDDCYNVAVAGSIVMWHRLNQLSGG